MFAREFEEDIDDSSPLNTQPSSPTLAHFGASDIGWAALGPAIAFNVLAMTVLVLR